MARTRPSNGPAPEAIRSLGSRLALILVLALGLASATGCMVMDELDTAAAKMPTTAAEKAKQNSEKTAPASAADRLAAAKRMVDQRSAKWWSEAKSIAPGEVTTGIVSCRMPEGTQFMTKDDCLSQGGEPAAGRG